MGEPYILNVIGDFYVEANCCTLCGVPEAIAPDLFATSDRGHCYVKKQPESADEFDRMTKVFATQDLGCIRYRGTDTQILNELEAVGERDRCDFPRPASLWARLLQLFY